MTQLELTFLGTAGTIPTPERNVSALALRYGEELLLFDCGEGTQRQLMCSALSFMRVRRIFLSHFHGDHYFGLPGLLSTMRMNERTLPIDLYIPVGTRQRLEQFLGEHAQGYGFPLEIHEVRAGTTLAMDGYSLRCERTDHRILTLAWSFVEDARPGRFDRPKALALGVPVGPLFGQLQRGQAVTVDGRTVTPEQVLGPPRRGRKIVYSSDTRPCEAVIQLAKGADVLVHDSTLDQSLTDLAKEYGHSTAVQAAQVATAAGARHLVLTHLSGRYRDPTPLLHEAQAAFAGTVTLAHDLLVLPVAMPEDDPPQAPAAPAPQPS